MRDLLIAIVLALASCTVANAGWTVVYDFNRGKPVVIYTPDRPCPRPYVQPYGPNPYVQPYNPYVYPAPCPYDYRPAPRPYDYHRHDRERNHRNPCH